MRTRFVPKPCLALVLVAGLAYLSLPARAAAEDKGIIALQQSVSLLMSQVADLQKAFNSQVSVIQGLVTQNTDTVNKLSSTLDGIQRAISGNQVIAGQQQTDIGKQFQALADTLAAVQAHLQKMDETLQQVHQLQQTLPAPSMVPIGATGGQTGDPNNPGMTGDLTKPNGMPSTVPAAGSPSQLYQNALTDFQNNSPAAQGEFASFIRNYPNDPQIPDASYYLGSIFLQKQQYNEAIDRFDQVIEQYPDNAKAAPAELNKGIALAKSGNKTAAISELRALVKNHPGTEAARQGDLELKSLGAGRGREK